MAAHYALINSKELLNTSQAAAANCVADWQMSAKIWWHTAGACGYNGDAFLSSFAIRPVSTIAAESSPEAYSSPGDAALAAAQAPPTKVRLEIIFLCVLMSILLYLDRLCVGPVQATMIEELGVTKEAFGRAVGVFFMAYALLMVPTGWFADRLGCRITLTSYAALWGLATIALGFVNGLTMLIAVRILIGVSQAGAYPAAAIVLKRWAPASSRARASSFVTTGGRFGGLLAFALTPLLASFAASALGWRAGAWRIVFVGYGVATVAWAAWFSIRFRNRPDEHPGCNFAERALIAETLPAEEKTATPKKPVVFSLSSLACSPSLWFLSLINILQNIGWIFLVTWLTQYLIEHYQTDLLAIVKRPQDLAGPLTALTGLAGMLGNLTGGIVSDVSVSRLGKRWGRRVSGVLAGALAGSMYLIAWGSGNLWLTVGVMAGAYFFADLAIGSMWATLQDVGGRNVGSILGFTNMCGNLAAGAAAWWFGYLAQHDHWPAVFLISALSFFAVAACWLGIDASRPLSPEDETA